jgi:hypothetical protein
MRVAGDGQLPLRRRMEHVTVPGRHRKPPLGIQTQR